MTMQKLLHPQQLSESYRLNSQRTNQEQILPRRTNVAYPVKPVFHFARIVPKRTGEHAQIENRFINPRTSGCIRVSK
jgi:hypothetical protein